MRDPDMPASWLRDEIDKAIQKYGDLPVYIYWGSPQEDTCVWKGQVNVVYHKYDDGEAEDSKEREWIAIQVW